MKTQHSKGTMLAAAAALALGAAAWSQWISTSDMSEKINVAREPISQPEVPTAAEPQQTLPADEESPHYTALYQTGDEKVRNLTSRVMSASTARDCASAADALAAHGTFDAVNNLVNLALIQRNATTRRAILESFGNVSTEEGLEALASVITATRERDVMDAAIERVGAAGDAEIVHALVDFYRERNDGPTQKRAAIRAIAAMRNPETSRVLGKLAAHAPEPALADAARSALSSMNVSHGEDRRGDLP